MRHDDLRYSPATDHEWGLLAADDALTVQLAAAIEAHDGDLCNDILDEKIEIEKLFQASRERTWFTSMREHFPEVMAPYSNGRPAA